LRHKCARLFELNRPPFPSQPHTFHTHVGVVRCQRQQRARLVERDKPAGGRAVVVHGTQQRHGQRYIAQPLGVHWRQYQRAARQHQPTADSGKAVAAMHAPAATAAIALPATATQAAVAVSVPSCTAAPAAEADGHAGRKEHLWGRGAACVQCRRQRRPKRGKRWWRWPIDGDRARDRHISGAACP